MNSDSLDPRWVRTWAADITTHLQSVLDAFDTYYPFPPGQNEVILAGPDQGSLDALRAQPNTSSDLITFYQVIQEVTMSDIGNGIFIHAPDDVITQLADGPVLLDEDNTGTIFASNGAGILYAINRDNTVHRSHDACTDSGFEPVAPTCMASSDRYSKPWHTSPLPEPPATSDASPARRQHSNTSNS